MTFNSALLDLAEAEMLNAHVCPFCGAVVNEAGVTLIRIGKAKQMLVDSYELTLHNDAHKRLTEPVLFVIIQERNQPRR